MRWLRGNLQQLGYFLRAPLSPAQKIAFGLAAGFWTLALIRPFTLMAPAFYFFGGLKMMTVGHLPLWMTNLGLSGPEGWFTVFLGATFASFLLGMGIFITSMFKLNQKTWHSMLAMGPDHVNIIQSATSAIQALCSGVRAEFEASFKKGYHREVPFRKESRHIYRR